MLGIQYNEVYTAKATEYISNVIDAERSDGKVIILGDSHAFKAIDNELIGKNMLNLSYPSDSLMEMYIKLGYLLENGKKIKYLVLPADYHIFSSYRLNNNNCDFIVPLVSTDIYNKIYSENISAVEKKLLEFNPFLLSRERTKISRWIFNKMLIDTINHDGANMMWSDTTNEYREHQTNLRLNKQLAHTILEKNLQLYYTQIVELCFDNEIEIIAIRYPVSSEYSEQLKKYDIEKVNRYIDNLEFVEYVDYTNVFNEYPNYFSDMDHLNDQGSLVFTEVLIQDIKEKGIIH